MRKTLVGAVAILAASMGLARMRRGIFRVDRLRAGATGSAAEPPA